MPPMPALSITAESALTCASAVKTGLRTSRRRSALSPSSCVETVKIGLDRIERPVFERELEQRGGVTARHAGNDGLLACHVSALLRNLAGSAPSPTVGPKPLN